MDLTLALSSTVTSWEVLLVEEVADWFVDLSKNDPVSADLVEDAIDRLCEVGPALGRPLVDRVQGSRHHHMKELRPGSAGRTEIRILFIFDPVRRAVLLVAGDKAGDWKGWYDRAIPIADARCDAHLAEIETREYQ